MSVKIESCPYVSDYRTAPRSFKERLLSLPWTPLKRCKSVYSPKIYQMADGTLICSPETAKRIGRGLNE